MRLLSVLLSDLAVVTALATAPCAHAALGSVPSDLSNGARTARQLSALAAASAGPVSAAYSVSETTLESGTVVREYVGASGAVFAVSWSGPFLPDLRTLLGERFVTLTAATAAGQQRGRGHVGVASADVVIESGGHMRAWSGRAWLPGALPAGWDTGAFQ
ncbi:DUF2844 domain-containing protein [Massilia sp. PWRC2]|uniref:DUF2844 domain-containing protein n=1 Tax=Massilia sp. PWRC2 TaxID=2804626 RepID=UPI003CEB998E